MTDSASAMLFVTTEVCVHGKEFKLLRQQQRLSLALVAARMTDKGWSYYPSKLFRLEKKMKFCLTGQEMMDLLDTIGVGFEVKE